MRKLFSERKRVVVYFGAEEHAKIERRASGSVSAYVRHVVLAELDGEARPARAPRSKQTIQELKEIPGVTTASEIEQPKRGKTCIHSVERGHHCWQCGGKAKVE
jgi:hypothetical protein